MVKPIIFISHITEEGEVAKKLKEIILDHYRESIEVFVSSDFKSISGGTDYFNEIIDNLDNCKLMITLCSPESVKREWINFETGYGYSRKIQVIPILYKGIDFKDINSPISRLQGYKIGEESLNNILELIDDKTGFKHKYYDFEEFLKFIKDFESKDNSLQVFINDFIVTLGRANLEKSLFTENFGDAAMVETTKDKYKKLEELVFEAGLIDDIKFISRGAARSEFSGFTRTGFVIEYSESFREELIKHL